MVVLQVVFGDVVFKLGPFVEGNLELLLLDLRSLLDRVLDRLYHLFDRGKFHLLRIGGGITQGTEIISRDLGGD